MNNIISKVIIELFFRNVSFNFDFNFVSIKFNLRDFIS